MVIIGFAQDIENVILTIFVKKQSMKDQNKEKRFIDLPEYPGGKEAYKEYIRKNLKYPKEALDRKIEGVVHVHYRVNGLGRVIKAEVTHGIGHACDEEALRLVRSLKYGKAKNRGVKVTASMRTKIHFKLPQQPGIQFNYVANKKTEKQAAAKIPKKEGESYGYTISF